MSLPQRSLGIRGPRVTAMGLGLMGMSAFYGKPLPDAERFKLLDHAFASGELFWDTADVYGDSEDLIGRWFQHAGEKPGGARSNLPGNQVWHYWAGSRP